jgi:hypothetical protein
MSKYSLVHLQLRNLSHLPRRDLVSTIQLPAGTTTTYYPAVPDNVDEMTVAELKAYAISEFEKANDTDGS